MSSINSFEDIESWQIARKLTKRIYEITEEGTFRRDFGLRDQIRRSSVSVMSNIAEGFERDGAREFIQHLSIAKGSAGEVRSQLYVARDIGHLNAKTFNELSDMTGSILRLLGGLMKYLQSTDHRGLKYR